MADDLTETEMTALAKVSPKAKRLTEMFRDLQRDMNDALAVKDVEIEQLKEDLKRANTRKDELETLLAKHGYMKYTGPTA